jgi:hypothetical protein
MTTDNLESHPEPARALTRQEFCALEHISLTTYHRMQQLGHGPDEVRLPGLAFVRITAEARRDWHARIEEYRKSDAAKIEDQRRTALATMAGNAAAKSPRHVSKRAKPARRSAK